MIPYLLAIAGGYLIAQSRKQDTFANGGTMDEGGLMKDFDKNFTTAYILQQQMADKQKVQGVAHDSYDTTYYNEKYYPIRYHDGHSFASKELYNDLRDGSGNLKGSDEREVEEKITAYFDESDVKKLSGSTLHDMWKNGEGILVEKKKKKWFFGDGGEVKITNEYREFDVDVFNEVEDEELFGFLVKDGKKEIGIVRAEEDVLDKGVGYILGLEVFEMNKGYGKKIIKKLFQLHPTQKSFGGKATSTSKGFWLKMGAEFENEYDFILKRENLSYSKGGTIEEALERFDVTKLDAFEKMQYNNFSKSVGKQQALQVLINSVEGDFSELSPDLRAIAEKFKMAKGGSIYKSDIVDTIKQLKSVVEDIKYYKEQIESDEISEIEKDIYQNKLPDLYANESHLADRLRYQVRVFLIHKGKPVQLSASEYEFSKSYLKKGGKIKKNRYYIEFLNKKKGFARDKKVFDTEEEAVRWGRKNLERFNYDMLKIQFD